MECYEKANLTPTHDIPARSQRRFIRVSSFARGAATKMVMLLHYNATPKVILPVGHLYGNEPHHLLPRNLAFRRYVRLD